MASPEAEAIARERAEQAQSDQLKEVLQILRRVEKKVDRLADDRDEKAETPAPPVMQSSFSEPPADKPTGFKKGS